MQVQRSTTRRAEAPTSNSRLSALNLSHTGVTGAAVPGLCALRRLESLSLYGCKAVGDAALERLDRELPGLAFLGFYPLDGDAFSGGGGGGDRREARRPS